MKTVEICCILRYTTTKLFMQMSAILKKNKKHFLIILIGLIIIFFFYKCPLHYLIGIPCPGCGFTRACMTALTLHFKEAFYDHPLFFLVIPGVVYYGLYYFKIFRFSKKIEEVIFILLIIAFFLTYIIRIKMGSEIVSIDLKSSLFFRIATQIKK